MSRNPRSVAFHPRRAQQIGGRATYRARLHGGARSAFHGTPGHGLARNRGRAAVPEKRRATPDLLHPQGAKCNRSGVARPVQRLKGARPHRPIARPAGRSTGLQDVGCGTTGYVPVVRSTRTVLCEGGGFCSKSACLARPQSGPPALRGSHAAGGMTRSGVRCSEGRREDADQVPGRRMGQARHHRERVRLRLLLLGDDERLLVAYGLRKQRDRRGDHCNQAGLR